MIRKIRMWHETETYSYFFFFFFFFVEREWDKLVFPWSEDRFIVRLYFLEAKRRSGKICCQEDSRIKEKGNFYENMRNVIVSYTSVKKLHGNFVVRRFRIIWKMLCNINIGYLRKTGWWCALVKKLEGRRKYLCYLIRELLEFCRSIDNLLL